jgi:hypothetical protein
MQRLWRLNHLCFVFSTVRRPIPFSDRKTLRFDLTAIESPFQVTGSPPFEIPAGFDEGDEFIGDEEWREKYIIDARKYGLLVEKEEDPREEELDEKEKLRKYLYELVHDFYKVDPGRVDHAFYGVYCGDDNSVKLTKEIYLNYLM